MAKVVLFGSGRGAITAYKYLKYDTDHEIVAFTVNEAYLTDTELEGIPVVPFEKVTELYPPTEYKLFASLGFDDLNRVRQKVYEAGKEKGYEFISYVHSSNKTLEPLVIGENCFILENQSLNIGVEIGNNVVMWSGNQIGDRVKVGDHVWISSHVCISGNVQIGNNTILGVNATVSHDIFIGEENYIGANALIAKNTGPKEVYVVSGTPKAAFASDRFMRLLKRPT